LSKRILSILASAPRLDGVEVVLGESFLVSTSSIGEVAGFVRLGTLLDCANICGGHWPVSLRDLGCWLRAKAANAGASSASNTGAAASVKLTGGIDGGGGGGGGAGVEAVVADWFVPSADPSDAGVAGVVGAGCWSRMVRASTCADSWAICSWLTL